MSNFVRLTAQSELPPDGEAKEFSLGDNVICVANVNGTISAMDNVCLHRGGPLGQGMIEGGKVVCPWHGYEYGTNLQHGLMLARQILDRQRGANRQIVVITDGDSWMCGSTCGSLPRPTPTFASS